jgi:hypothetical protein
MLGMHGGFQSNWKLHNAMLEALPESKRSIYAQKIAGEKDKIREEIRLLHSAGINPGIIVESAEKTRYGDIEYIETEPVYFRQYVPETKNSPYDLWFPAATDSAYPVSIIMFDESDLPLKFVALRRNYLGEAKKANANKPRN